jgi:hypothetical protein
MRLSIVLLYYLYTQAVHGGGEACQKQGKEGKEKGVKEHVTLFYPFYNLKPEAFTSSQIVNG